MLEWQLHCHPCFCHGFQGVAVQLPSQHRFFNGLLRLLGGPLTQFIELDAQAVAQGAFRPQFVEQRFGPGERLIGAGRAAKKDSPRMCNLMFCKQETPRIVF
jgi:hypothetical protein